MNKERHPTSFRITAEGVAWLDEVAERYGLSRSGALELTLREAMRRLDLTGGRLGRNRLSHEEEPRGQALAESSP